MAQHPNRNFGSDRVQPPAAPEQKPLPLVRVVRLDPKEYEALEAKFVIDPRGDFAFQLGAQAVLKALRNGFVVT